MPDDNTNSSINPLPGQLDGLRVVALESRMSDQTAILIRRAGGVAVSAPSMRELPLESNQEAIAFADALLAGKIDIVIFLTGVGAKHLAEAIETKYPARTWLDALGKTVVVCRGPKPFSVLRGWGVRVDVQVPEPNTSRDLLEALDKSCPTQGKRIAIQEYGQPNQELIQGLTDRGVASIMQVPVYRWALPEDLEPLKSAIQSLIKGDLGCLVVTSAQQIRHVMQVAEAEHLKDELLKAINTHVIVGSVGPVATEALLEYGIKADIEPEHPKLGPLIQALANNWQKTSKAIPPQAFGNHSPGQGPTPA